MRTASQLDQDTPGAEIVDFSRCKICRAPALERYRIRWAQGVYSIYACTGCRLHYLGYLDDTQGDRAPETARLSEQESRYIAGKLQSNLQRFESQVKLVTKYLEPARSRILDIGAGGGLFLKLLRDLGADVQGVEPNVTRIEFARRTYGLALRPELSSSPFWQAGFRESFDGICLWDVIEHVNQPAQEIEAAANLLKPGGYLFLDTPNRESGYYRFGQLTYSLSGGKLPTTLRMVYSPTPFAHKQIFAPAQLRRVLEEAGLRVIAIEQMHEHSFPCEFYLQKMFRNETLIRLTVPLVKALLSVVQVRNKMVIVARRPGETLSK